MLKNRAIVFYNLILNSKFLIGLYKLLNWIIIILNCKNWINLIIKWVTPK